MSLVRRFDHVGLTVSDLDRVTAFFVALGLQIEGRTFVEGEFVDTVCGIPDSRTEIVMLKPPDGGTRLDLSTFLRPGLVPGSPAATANELGWRSLAFEVDDLPAVVEWAAAQGYGLVGGVGEYEGVWRMAYVRGPEEIIVAVAQRIGGGAQTPDSDAPADQVQGAGLDPRVLVIGLDPYRVPGPWDPRPIADGIEVGRSRFLKHGVGADFCLVGLDGSDDVEAVVTAALRAHPWECVVIGGGVRSDLALFERIINLVRRHAPAAAVAFNSTPSDTFEAAARWLGRS